jgi:purine-binding chemotaxis protein CheW
MSDTRSRLAGRAAELRLAFDRGFAEPVRLDLAVKESLLAIRSGPQAWAVRLSQIAGLYAGKKITRLPTRRAALLGIAGFRGAIMPVYDLGMLLGQANGAVGGEVGGEARRWLLIAAEAPVALAFDAFDGHLLVSPDAILPDDSGEGRGAHVHGFVRAQDVVRPIVHLPGILAAIRTLEASKTLEAGKTSAPGTASREER